MAERRRCCARDAVQGGRCRSDVVTRRWGASCDPWAPVLVGKPSGCCTCGDRRPRPHSPDRHDFGNPRGWRSALRRRRDPLRSDTARLVGSGAWTVSGRSDALACPPEAATRRGADTRVRCSGGGGRFPSRKRIPQRDGIWLNPASIWGKHAWSPRSPRGVARADVSFPAPG